LANKIDPSTVRVRRDFTTIISLIRTHAILYQCQREIDDEKRIIAQIADYRAIYNLVNGLISEGVNKSVDKIIRETVEAVKILLSKKGFESSVSQSELVT
jgi:hypothetical protein